MIFAHVVYPDERWTVSPLPPGKIIVLAPDTDVRFPPPDRETWMLGLERLIGAADA